MKLPLLALAPLARAPSELRARGPRRDGGRWTVGGVPRADLESGFTCELTVDGDGLVVEYDLWLRC